MGVEMAQMVIKGHAWEDGFSEMHNLKAKVFSENKLKTTNSTPAQSNIVKHAC